MELGDRPRPVDDPPFTLDYPDDYALVARSTRPSGERTGRGSRLEDVLALLEERPELREVNARYAGVNWYRHHLSDLRTVPASATRASAENAIPPLPLEARA